jgi:hypothetical protein
MVFTDSAESSAPSGPGLSASDARLADSPVVAQTEGPGEAGQSLKLNGRGYGTISNGDPIDFAAGGTFAVEFWVNPDADSDADAWIMRQGGSWGVQWLGTGEERRIKFQADGFSDNIQSSDGVPAGEWTHVAIVYDGSNRNIYLDGELDTSSSGSDGPGTSNNRVRFGSNDAANGQFFVGQVDNVRLWNTDRNLIQIQNDQFVELDGTESGLDHLYQFDGDASGGPGVDAAGSSDISLTGDAEIVDGDSNPAPPYVHARPENGSVTVDLAERFDPAGQNDPSEWRLYRSTSPDPDTASLVTTLQPPTTSYTDTGVSNGQRYFYWATAVDSTGEGDFSKAASASPFGKTGESVEVGPNGGQGGSSLELDGRSWATLSDRQSIDRATGNEFAIEFWVKPDADSDEDAWIMRKQGSWGVQWTGTGEERQIFFQADGFNDGITSNDGVQAGVWTHVAIVYDGSNRNIYLDGQLDKSSSGSDGPGTTGNDLVLGSNGATNAQFFVGEIDDLRLWERSRGASAIEENYTAELVGSESGLVGYWQFDTSEASGTATRGSTYRHGTVSLKSNAQISEGGAYPVGTDTYVHSRNNNATVTWSVRTDSTPDAFAVWRKSASADESGWTLIERIEDSTARTYVDESASNGQNYHYAVTAVVAGQESDFARGAPARPYDARGGGALSVDGAQDTRGLVTDRPSLNVMDGNEFTIEFWVKPDASSDDDAWIMRKQGAWGVQWTGTGEERELYFKADGFNDEITSRAGVQAGVWTHVAIVYDGSNRNVYLNGRLDKQLGSSDAPTPSGNDLSIGANDAGNDRYFDGRIDEIAFWDDARTSDQLEATYNDRLTGNETDLHHYWQFDEQGADASRSTTRRHATVDVQGQAAVESPGAMPVTPRTYARADVGSVDVSWRVRNLAETTDVGIYRSTQRNLGDRAFLATVDADTETRYTDAGLSNGQTRFYQATAVNTDGQESDYAFEAGALPSQQTGGNAFQLTGNGTSSYGTLTDRASIDHSIGNKFAVEFWVNPDADSDENAWIMRKQGSWGVQWTGTGDARQIFFQADGFNDGITSDSTVPAGEWTHVAIVYDGSNRNVYLDGQLDTSSSGADGPSASGNDLRLGVNGATNAQFFKGEVDELRIWDDPRSDSEIRRNYDNELAGSDDELVGYWRGAFTTDNESVTGNARKPMTLGLNNLGPVDSNAPLDPGGVDTTTVDVALDCAPNGLVYYQVRLNATSGESIRSIEGGPEFGADSVTTLEGGPGISSVTAAGEFSADDTTFSDRRVLFSAVFEGAVIQDNVDVTVESLRGGDGEITGCDVTTDVGEPQSPPGADDGDDGEDGATASATITAEPATAGETSARHDVNVTVGADAGGSSLNGVEIDYSAGANPADASNVGSSTVEVAGLDTQGDAGVDVDVSDDLSSVSTSNNGETLTLGFGGSYDLQQGDRVLLEYAPVQNPATSGSTDVDVTLNPQSASETSTATLQIEPADDGTGDNETDTTLDVGIELQQEATVAQGGSVDVDTFPFNNAEQSVSGTMELLVDQNSDGQFDSSEVVTSRSVTLAGGASATETLTYSNVGLAAGNYSYQARFSSGGQTETSFTNGTLTVTAGDGDTGDGNGVRVTTSGDTTVAPGEETTVTFTVTNTGSDTATSGGLQVSVPAVLSVSSVSGDGSNSPERFFIDPIAPGESVTVTYTLAAEAGASLGPVTVDATATLNNQTGSRSASTSVGVDVSESGGLPTEPGEPSFGDVLEIISAFNNGTQFNGVDVGFPDVLEVISAFNAG